MPAQQEDLYSRAVRVFGTAVGGGIKWPYGVATPSRWHYRNDETPDRYEAAVQDRKAAQEKVTAWAGRYGLRQSSADCCPLWLQRRRSRRCLFGSGSCTRYGTPAPDRGWLDHATLWNKNQAPAVITSAPYSIDPDDRIRLAWWLEQDPRFRVAYGDEGWYGFGTRQIVLWRQDLLETVTPA
ncbi:hypothetical protein [Streptomyces sp. STR69]|uniref:hypothetical protein n=1 Tax=Streptomyces sp. STR69 TaxID=1796942 RepID=UPI0021C9B28D|nr:hypothetical protein [Streptomyces sp. STR69]